MDYYLVTVVSDGWWVDAVAVLNRFGSIAFVAMARFRLHTVGTLSLLLPQLLSPLVAINKPLNPSTFIIDLIEF